MQNLTWWQSAVFYQIYPRSFADSDGDGVGDLQGIIDRLDYLHDLGVDAIWLSPHYPSPLFDCGYDVADYTGVAPEYGMLDDFRRLLDGLHRRGMRLILDLVLNHTSHQHPWFVASRSSRDDPKRNWYVWHDGRDGGPPNNWQSCFGGSAWEYDPATAQYYYHFFLKEQPDLNWRNTEVKEAVFDAVRFWLDLGVDGFRIDAIDTIYEEPGLPDHEATLTPEELNHRIYAEGHNRNAPELRQQWKAIFQHQLRRPGIHDLFRDLRTLIDSYPDRVLVGETDDLSYYGNGTDELHMIFNFPLMKTDRLTPAWIRANQAERLEALPEGAWPCNTLGNHDTPRIYSHYGDGEHNDAQARLSLALMLTLRGTPFLYNGEEIGMSDYYLTDVKQFRDLLGIWHYRLHAETFGEAEEVAVKRAARTARDKCRTPMQWSRDPHGGFCPEDAAPWLPVNPDYAAGVNVADQDRNPDSLLNFYRRMLALRRRTPALVGGDYTPLHEDAEGYLAFVRSSTEQRCIVALNFSNRWQSVTLPPELGTVTPLFSVGERPAGENLEGKLELAPFEIYVGEIGGAA